ncbi:MAG: hypothetical protein U0237_05275 [Thermoleophilia bacterium]
MIVRVLGEGQFRLADGVFSQANSIDDRLQAAVESDDAEGFSSALADLIAFITSNGTPVPADELIGSDAIVPAPDTTLEEVRSLLGDEGLIPD